MRLQAGRGGLEVEAASVGDLLPKVAAAGHGLSLADLRNSLIFVNGTAIQNLRGFKTKLSDGDEVQIFSPMAGG